MKKNLRNDKIKIIGYYLHSEYENEFLEEAIRLTSFGCQAVFTDEYTSASKDFPTLNRLVSKLDTNDKIIIKNLSSIAISIPQLKKITNQFYKKRINLICMEQNINTEEQGWEDVHKCFQLFFKANSKYISRNSNKSRKKDLTYTPSKTDRKPRITLDTIAMARNAYNLRYVQNIKSKDVMKILKLKKLVFYKYIKLVKSGKIDAIEEKVKYFASIPKLPVGRAPGLSKEAQLKVKRLKILRKSTNLQVSEIINQLDISKATYYRYLKS